MKILLIQERGRHAKNREFREALCLQRSLSRLGIDSTVWGLGYENFSETFSSISKSHDVVLSLENYDTGWHPNISAFGGLKCFWSIDSHCVLHDHVRFCKANNIDLLLNSSEQYIPAFSSSVKYAAWFPNGYPSDLISPRENVERNVDVGFCGSSIDSRNAVMNSIEKEVKIKRDIFVIGEDMVQALSSYKIAFNYNIADDINFRTFEASAAGAVVLTNYTPNLEKLFEIGKEIVVYESLPDLVRKAKDLLANPDDLAKISSSGRLRSSRDHTYDSRASQLIDILKQVS